MSDDILAVIRQVRQHPLTCRVTDIMAVCDYASTCAEHVQVPAAKMALLKEAWADENLPDGAFRVSVASLLWPTVPTAEDIEWGRREAENVVWAASAESAPGTGSGTREAVSAHEKDR